MKRLLLFLICSLSAWALKSQMLYCNGGGTQFVCEGDSVVLGGNPTAGGGVPPYIYNWIPASGTSTPALNNPHLANPVAYPLPGIVYRYLLIVTDSLGHSERDSAIVYAEDNLPATIAFASSINGCVGEVIQFVDSTASYLDGTWYFGDGTNTQFDSSYTIIKPHAYTQAGIFTVILTKSYWLCSSSDTLQVQIDVCDIVGRSTSCFNVCDGGAYVNAPAVPLRRFLWSNGDTLQQVLGLCAGYYSCIVFDSLSIALDTLFVTITQPDTLTATINTVDITCNTPEGFMTAYGHGGTAPYFYQWSTGVSMQWMNSLGPYTYIVTVTDINNCQAHAIDTVFDYTFEVKDSIVGGCAGSGSGKIYLSFPSGGIAPFSFHWSNGATTNPAVGLIPGQYYSVTVTDSTGCVSFRHYNIPGLPAPNATVSSIPAYCADSSGSATVNTVGGKPPYSFLWNTTPPQLTSAAITLAAGAYSVTVTDSNGCRIIKPVTVARLTDTSLHVQLISSVKPVCAGAQNGSIHVASTGGTAPYNYYWNTTPPQNTAMATQITAGSYAVTVIDAAGCQAYKSFQLQNASNNAVLVTPSVVAANCPANNSGKATVTVIAGTAPYSYVWNTNPVQYTSSATGLPKGTYYCTITDANNCSKVAQLVVPYSNNIYASLNSNYPNCSSTGQISAAVTGGIGPYTYNWNTGQTTSAITNLAGNQCYTVTVTGANGCSVSRNACLGNNPGNLISGSIYNDVNANCIQDSGEINLKDVLVRVIGGNQSFVVSSDFYGRYKVWVPQGNYAISVVLQSMPYWNLECPLTPGNYAVAFSNNCDSALHKDFGLRQMQNVNDLWVNLSMGTPRPAFTHSNSIFCKNRGSVAINAQLELRYDPKFALSSFTPAYSSYAGNVVVWNLGVLQPSQSKAINYNSTVPLTYQGLQTLGMMAADTAIIYPIIGDSVPADNIDIEERSITGAFDPNFKECYPAAAITSNDSVLKYTIHFQNTGTDTAYTVIVVDTLPQYLEPASIVQGLSSHAYKFDLQHEGIITWRFDSIMLPDSTADEPNSHGYVSFKVKTKKNLAVGTSVNNRAAIYFDFNEPIITNATQNILTDPSYIFEPGADGNGVTVKAFPNPFSEATTVIIDGLNSEFDFRLFDVTGRLANTINAVNTNRFELKRGALPAGIYFYQITTSGGKVANGKLVVQ